MLATAGLHVPVIPFEDVVGNTGTVPPAQIVRVVPNGKVGGIFGLMVMVNVEDNAHNPAVGVKVYTAEFWLSVIAGFHVPVIPFDDVVGRTGSVPPAHIVSEVPNAKVGVIFGVTVTANVAGNAHKPAVGVNV